MNDQPGTVHWKLEATTELGKHLDVAWGQGYEAGVDSVLSKYRNTLERLMEAASDLYESGSCGDDSPSSSCVWCCLGEEAEKARKLLDQS